MINQSGLQAPICVLLLLVYSPPFHQKPADKDQQSGGEDYNHEQRSPGWHNTNEKSTEGSVADRQKQQAPGLSSGGHTWHNTNENSTEGSVADRQKQQAPGLGSGGHNASEPILNTSSGQSWVKNTISTLDSAKESERFNNQPAGSSSLRLDENDRTNVTRKPGRVRVTEQSSSGLLETSTHTLPNRTSLNKDVDKSGLAGGDPKHPCVETRDSPIPTETTNKLTMEGRSDRILSSILQDVEFSDPTDSDDSASGGLNSSRQSPPCGFNACLWSLPCYHGGTCSYDTGSCSLSCRCPPPYDDPQLYDKHCRDLDSPPIPHASGPTSTTHVLAERDCGGAGQLVCEHGVCQVSHSQWYHTLSFRCVCDTGWYGSVCDLPCSKSCSNGGVCRYDNANGTEECDCPYPWVGATCTDTSEQDSVWTSWLVGGSALAVLGLLTVAAVFVYCLWRRRLVVAMRLVYRFQPFEDGDGRQFDAFISYVSSREDEHFVHNILYPKLEKELGFVVCMHQRDFVVGETISNNIVNALEASRRFILVLSPRYLHSAWAEFEYQQAFHKMLQRRMRIVPVILEDVQVTGTVNPTLRAILDSVTHIRYPGRSANLRQLRTFWKRVELSMPKTRSRQVVTKPAENGERRISSQEEQQPKWNFM